MTAPTTIAEAIALIEARRDDQIRQRERIPTDQFHLRSLTAEAIAECNAIINILCACVAPSSPLSDGVLRLAVMPLAVDAWIRDRQVRDDGYNGLREFADMLVAYVRTGKSP